MESVGKRCPVDFDHHTEDHAKDWVRIYRELRERSPRAWTNAHGGYWVATKFQDIIDIAQRDDVFSTHKEDDPITGEPHGGVSIPAMAGVRAFPNELDKPDWTAVRGLINRPLGPRAVERRRQRTRELVTALIDRVIERGTIDIVDDLTNPLPALVTMDLFGFPLHEWRDFANPFHRMVYTSPSDPAFTEAIRGLDHFHQRLDEELAIRRQEPKDDLLTVICHGTIDDTPLTSQQMHDLSFDILAGGVDTTTALTSNTLLFLCENPDLRRRLCEEPEIRKLAREEFLRFFSPIHGLARNAIADVDIGGWEIAKGDRVLLAYSAGNRDPEAFDEPDEVRIDRYPNKHITFGAGMHRCVGSFLARMMWDEMVDQVLSRMPDLRVIEARLEPYPSVGKVNGWIHIPATFTPGEKVGSGLAELGLESD